MRLLVTLLLPHLALAAPHAGYSTCARALSGVLLRLEPAPLARVRLGTAARDTTLAPLAADEVRLLRQIERHVASSVHIPTEITTRLLSDYRGPREGFVPRLRSTLDWFEALGRGEVVPAGRDLDPFTAMLWSNLRAEGWATHRVRWTNVAGATGLIEQTFVAPSWTLLEGVWPGDRPLLKMLTTRLVPIENFLGVTTPWPVLVAGRVIEQLILSNHLDLFTRVSEHPDDLTAFLLATNHHVLEWQLQAYRLLVAKRPEFRSRLWDQLTLERVEGRPHPRLTRAFGHADGRYIAVLKTRVRD